jgi:adenine-specific DNA-methyltransferase
MAKIQRLNYIGSKFNLLSWIETTIREKTGWVSLEDKLFADLFAGTGIVSYHFRCLNTIVISNDAELYSSIITQAMTSGTYTEQCRDLIYQLNATTEELVGFVTRHYSPYETSERMFFTEENAKRIDYLRQRIEDMKPTLSENEYGFLLASLLVSADAVSNVPAVYGCYLKNFKDKAMRTITLIPIHTHTRLANEKSQTTNMDVLALPLITADIVYLDPPYNQRQYSKNYFPLNIIAKTPSALLQEPELKGKTGIPTDCFTSAFCQKKRVEDAFITLLGNLRAEWVFLSYNSESLIMKDRMIEIMQEYGEVSVVERDYKRFKSFDYNQDVSIQEYLFCLKQTLH